MRHLDAIVATLVLIGLVAILAEFSAPALQVAGAVRVIDGDTIRLAGHTVRFAGMDAPELAQTCGLPGHEQPCGIAARLAVLRMTAGGATTCRITGQDRYRRDLGRCEVAGRDIGGALVQQGLAVAYGGYAREESEARAAGRGLWAAPFERPSDWRKAHPRAAFEEPAP
jgi:endonuclease YncB( thermonuclease family)